MFKTNMAAQTFVVLAVSAIMWLGSFIHPPLEPCEGGGHLFYWVAGLLSPTMRVVVGYVLMLAEGLMLTSMLYRHKMLPQSNMMPLLFYTLAMSVGQPTLSPALVGSFFLLFSIDQLLLTSTLLSIGQDKIFYASLSVACATLFCPAMAVMILPLFTNMFNYSLYGWRDWTMLILGLLAPYIVMETWFFMNDELFYRNYLIYYGLTDVEINIDGNWMDWVASVAFSLVVVISIVTAMLGAQGQIATVSKNTTAILLFITGGLAMSFYSALLPVDTVAYAVPFAFGATMLFTGVRHERWIHTLLFVLLILIFVVWNWI